jgi:transcriptional regulator with XRE-family HTH domain
MLDMPSKNAAMTIADRIQQLRKEHGLTQEDLAAKAGVGIATIQRLERGQSPTAKTIASIAAAFNLLPEVLTKASTPNASMSKPGSYLPLAQITSGKRLVDLMASASVMDFDYLEVTDEASADLISGFYEFCRTNLNSVLSAAGERIRLDMEALQRIKALATSGLTLSGEIYERTNYEVDDDGGTSMAILLAQWDETCLVIRIGTDSNVVDRADVEARMSKWTNTSDPRIVRPERPQSDEDEFLF